MPRLSRQLEVQPLEQRDLLSAAGTGALDVVFGTGGKVTTSFTGDAGCNSVALASDGKIVVAGSFDDSNALSDSVFALARYNADGSPDAAFGENGIVTTKFSDFDSAANRVLVQANG